MAIDRQTGRVGRLSCGCLLCLRFLELEIATKIWLSPFFKVLELEIATNIWLSPFFKVLELEIVTNIWLSSFV